MSRLETKSSWYFECSFWSGLPADSLEKATLCFFFFFLNRFKQEEEEEEEEESREKKVLSSRYGIDGSRAKQRKKETKTKRPHNEKRNPEISQIMNLISCQSSPVQFKMVSVRSEKPIIMRSTPSLRSFSNVAFETAPGVPSEPAASRCAIYWFVVLRVETTTQSGHLQSRHRILRLIACLGRTSLKQNTQCVFMTEYGTAYSQVTVCFGRQAS